MSSRSPPGPRAPLAVAPQNVEAPACCRQAASIDNSSQNTGHGSSDPLFRSSDHLTIQQSPSRQQEYLGLHRRSPTTPTLLEPTPCPASPPANIDAARLGAPAARRRGPADRRRGGPCAWSPTARPRSKAPLACRPRWPRAACPAPTRERIALAVAQINDCGYYLSAHSFMGKNLAKLAKPRSGRPAMAAPLDPEGRRAAVRFAAKVVRRTGPCVRRRRAGSTDGRLRQRADHMIVQHMALNTWTKFVNSVAQTEIDFPVAPALAA